MSQGRNKEGIWYIRSTQGTDACSSCLREFIKSVKSLTICFQYVSFLHKEYQHDWNELFHLPIRWAESVGTEAGAQGILELVYIHLTLITEMRKTVACNTNIARLFVFTEEKQKEFDTLLEDPGVHIIQWLFFFWNLPTDKCKHYKNYKTHCSRECKILKFIEISFLI